MSIELAKLIKTIALAKTCNNRKESGCLLCLNQLNNTIDWFVKKNLPLQFVLPAFPAKSANRDKTLSHLPDMGEFLALERLRCLLDQIKMHYAPGAHLLICSDGHVFNDIVGVKDEEVLEYKRALVKMNLDMGNETISFYDLQDAYPNQALDVIRQNLVKDFAHNLLGIQELVKVNLDEKALFNGLHRFLYEDFKALHPNRSNNQIRKLAHQRTYQTMQRSHAWGKLIEATFPHAIRLSIHPHTCQSGKLAFCLVPSSDTWATPWHNVVVKYEDLTVLMKRSEALRLGGKLVQSTHSLSHYVMESPCLQ